MGRLKIGAIGAAVALSFLITANAEPINPAKPASRKVVTQELRGTEQSPIYVKVQTPEKSKSERAKEESVSKESIATETRLADLTGDLAKYTLGLFIATALLAFLTVGLLVLGFFQISDAKKSIGAAVAAAEAAKEQVKLGREDFLASNRPELVITFVRTAPMADGQYPDSVEVAIINRGTSSGKLLGSGAVLQSYHPNLLPTPDLVGRTDFISPRKLEVGNTDTGSVALTGGAPGPTVKLYLLGWLACEDGLKQTRTTYFCWEFEKRGLLGESPERSSFKPVTAPGFNIVY